MREWKKVFNVRESDEATQSHQFTLVLQTDETDTEKIISMMADKVIAKDIISVQGSLRHKKNVNLADEPKTIIRKLVAAGSRVAAESYDVTFERMPVEQQLTELQKYQAKYEENLRKMNEASGRSSQPKSASKPGREAK